MADLDAYTVTDVPAGFESLGLKRISIHVTQGHTETSASFGEPMEECPAGFCFFNW